MNNTSHNLKALQKVAMALGDLHSQVVYVGGAVVSLYADDPAAEDVRPTEDVDIFQSPLLANWSNCVKT